MLVQVIAIVWILFHVMQFGVLIATAKQEVTYSYTDRVFVYFVEGVMVGTLCGRVLGAW